MYCYCCSSNFFWTIRYTRNARLHYLLMNKASCVCVCVCVCVWWLQDQTPSYKWCLKTIIANFSFCHILSTIHDIDCAHCLHQDLKSRKNQFLWWSTRVHSILCFVGDIYSHNFHCEPKINFLFLWQFYVQPCINLNVEMIKTGRT